MSQEVLLLEMCQDCSGRVASYSQLQVLTEHTKTFINNATDCCSRVTTLYGYTPTADKYANYMPV